MKNWKNLTLLLAAMALILAACGGQDEIPTPQPAPLPVEAVIAEGHLVPNDDLTLSFMVRGKVAEILVEKGDKVQEGDVLVRLADREQAEAALAAAQLELTTAQQTYDEFVRTEGLGRADAWQAYMDAQIVRAEAEREWEDLNLDNIDERIDDRRADVEDRKEDLDDAQEEYDKYKDLDEDNSKRKNAEDDLEREQENYNEALRDLEEEIQERDTVRAALDQTLATEAEAKHQYEISLDGPNAEQLALLEARLNNAQAQVASAENNLANYELKAPFDGEVMDINVSVNEMVGPESWAVIVADTSQWYVETSDLTELEVVDVAVGQSVNILADALPDVEMSGAVEEISQSFKSQGGDILYTVHIKVDDVDPRMRWGMTVEATFEPLE
ncbi:MAG: HlyD family efflux transporter periplasmic adaptor subunit [Anaerolineales bacterium]|nr:HlyD family efflux transporter periplasmic adaptor subunit [Anaerolineales bacterium]